MSHAMASIAIPLTPNGLDLSQILIAHANKPATVVDTVNLTCEARLALDKVIGPGSSGSSRARRKAAPTGILGSLGVEARLVEARRAEYF